ncbi:MAG: cell division protein FtsQ/DivIB [Burkholderiales bacterium]|nr:cell division protein FtsQ/DivIB [Burkholderiales bacterium]
MLAAAALNTPDEMPQDIRWMNAASAALLVLAVVLLLAAGLVKLSRLPFFNIAHLQLEGEMQRNNLATVRANALPRLSRGFFNQDLAKAREAFEAVPWVRRAVVRRVWPNELRVTLEEHRPAAYWHHEDRDDQLVNTFGEVFDANLGDVEDEPLPTLSAPANPMPDQAKVMLDMLHRLQPMVAPLQAEIDTLRLTDRGSWSVLLDNGADIELGRGTADEVAVRVERFVRTLPELQHQYPAPLAHADLRYPQGYAVRLRGVTTLQDAAKTAVKKR